MSTNLKVENLKYKDILKDININMKESTITALMGSSGSGKTLLLKSLFGLTDAEYIINYNDKIITKDNIDKIRKKFGIYLGLNKLEDKNVFLNIIEPLNNLNYDTDASKDKVYELSKKLGIENLLYKDINALSHSQKKIVSFAQSIIHEPKVIFIDGLFDSIDVYYKNKIVKYLKRLKKNNKCIIIFTTNNSEDLCFSDNLIVIKNKKILVNDSIDKLMENENLFTKNSIKFPFLVDLSYKLKAYDLIDKLIYNIEEMVDKIWQ